MGWQFEGSWETAVKPVEKCECHQIKARLAKSEKW